MVTRHTPIYIDQNNGTYKKYEGRISDLENVGWPTLAPAGSFLKGVSVDAAAIGYVRFRNDIDAGLFTLRDPSEREWEKFKQFVAKERAD